MPQPRLSDEDHRRLAQAYREARGDVSSAAKAFGIPESTFRTRMRVARKALGEGFFPKFEDAPKGGTRPLAKGLIDEAWAAYCEGGYNQEEAARILGIPVSTVKARIARAKQRGYEEPHFGDVDARQPRVLPLPAEGLVKRYILTCAQNNTRLHKPTWASLRALAEHYGAEIMIGTYTYVFAEQGSTKRGSEQAAAESANRQWYDPEIEPYVCDDYVQLAPGLAWAGHMNILPTAVSPLSGLENYTGRASGIFPHAKVAMESVATIKSDATKFNWTTGAVTLRNYIQKKAGLKGEFHHVYGALVAEVDSSGHWWVRQLISDKRGVIYDLDVVSTPSGIRHHEGVEAISWGDIHEDVLDATVRKLAWGEGGMLDTLRPRHQFFHDLLDFSRRSHHSRRDPHVMFRQWVEGRESIIDEIMSVGAFMVASGRPWCKSHVVRSNHDEHLERWLKEVDWRDDMANAEFYLDAQAAYLKAIREGREFNALAWAVRRLTRVKGVHWIGKDESCVICRDASGGIEMALHGDLGPNGARGSARNLSRLGRKAVIGHSHSARIVDGVYQAGVSGKLDMDYARGPSSWSASHVVVHRNGKRQIVTMFSGGWRAKAG